MSKKKPATPVRMALRSGSSLLASVKDGLGAVESSHHSYFDTQIRSAFADSLDADTALRTGREQENRWDYLLGHATSKDIFGVEPHSAKEDEITTVIKKRSSAVDQLRTHLRDGVKIAKWLWVASGKVHFANTEKARFRLDQNGIEFVGTRIMAKHLSVSNSNTSNQFKTAPKKKSR